MPNYLKVIDNFKVFINDKAMGLLMFNAKVILRQIVITSKHTKHQ